MSGIDIRPAVESDCEQLSRLCEALWPEAGAAEHGWEIALILAGKPIATLPLVIFVAANRAGVLTGFIEVGLRSHADGCDTARAVGFVEGWFVLEAYRRKGIASRLLLAAENWTRQQGCREMASDTWIDSDLSQRVHESLHFQVVDRCVHYRKAL